MVGLPEVVVVAPAVPVVVGHGLDGLGGTLAARICFLLVLQVL